MSNLLKVRLSLKGRPIRTYLFDQATVSIGRNPAADIFLDNTGISRDHAIIQRTSGGYVISDLGSANGTFLNEQPVHKQYVSEDDVVHIGKFALWMALEPDRRDPSPLGQSGPAAFEGTMVIEPDSLLGMQRKSAEIVDAPPPAAGPAPSTRRTPRVRSGLMLTAVFVAGSVTGWLLSHLARGG